MIEHRMKPKLYSRALRSWDLVTEIGHAVITGAALGSMDRADLAVVDEGYYDEVYEAVDGVPRRYVDAGLIRRGLFDWEQSTLSSVLSPGSRVVVMGAGSGREVHGLLAAGFDAHGYDPHPDLVREGQAVLTNDGHPGRLHVSVRDELPGAAGDADAVVVGWGVYTLIPGRARRIALLEALRDRLPPGAAVLLSFWSSPRRTRSLQITYRVAHALRRARNAEPVDLGDSLAPHYAHWFTEQEIKAEIAAAGLELAHLAMKPYGHALVTVPATTSA